MIPFLKPILPSIERLMPYFKCIQHNGYYSNNGPMVQQFEKALQTYLQTDREIVVVNNATIGLMLALKALDIEGKVLIPSFTFAATAAAISWWSGLDFDYVDIEPDHWCMDPSQAEADLQSGGYGAIMPVDALGLPCDKERFEQLADKYNVKLIFDSASSIGATYKGIPVGNFGDIEVFSLHATKCLPVGEGGFLSIKDPQVAQRVRMLKNFGFDNDREAHIEGINAKMPEMTAAIGIEALKDLPQHLTNRREYVELYRKTLKNRWFQRVRTGCQHGYQILSLLVPNAVSVVKSMEKLDIQVRQYYSPPLHNQSAYRRKVHLPITEGVSGCVISLPLWSVMSKETIDKVGKAVRWVE